VLPADEARSYYRRPVIKQPVWTWEIPWYFFVGGMAGVSSTLAAVAETRGQPALARSARRVAGIAAALSPALLIADLGRPERFSHMLRVVKPTSPLSLGTWFLSALAPAAMAAAVLAELGRFPRWRRASEVAAGIVGPAVSTYTAVLICDTAVPVWHEARLLLPMVFAGSASASAGAAATLLTPPAQARPARRLAATGALLELAASAVMRRQLGELAEPYGQGDAGAYDRASTALTLAGVGLVALTAGRRGPAALGSTLLLGGSLAKRWAVYRAGFQSAADPKYTIGPQRERLRRRASPP
jgi:formate-dependent nitrite reductase membrane component NrfD